MTNFMFIILLIIAIITIALLVNKPFRQQLLIKFRGRTEEIMNIDASTPEGAKDYYNVAIQEKEKIYNNTHDLYVSVSGKLKNKEDLLYKIHKEIAEINREIEKCINENRDEDAMHYSLKIETLEDKAQVLKSAVKELEKVTEEQKELTEKAEFELKKLKEEKERVLFELESNRQIMEVHASIDENVTNSETERMLEKVRDSNEKIKEKALGSRIVYESSSQARDTRLAKQSRESSARERIERMKRERNK